MTFIRSLTELIQEFLAGIPPWVAIMVLAAIIFAETGLLIGFFLPGDSLLFTAGLAASPAVAGWDPLYVVAMVVVLIAAAILGDSFNYYLGHQVGPRVFTRDNSFFFNRKHLLRAQGFYEKHGGKTVVMARFMPVVRTFAPFVAGIGAMNYRRFIAYNVGGAIGWVVLCVFAGYFLGQIEIVKNNFELAVVAILAVSIIPLGWEWGKGKLDERRKAKDATPA